MQKVSASVLHNRQLWKVLLTRLLMILLIMQLLLLTSCAASVLNRGPAWLSRTPDDSDGLPGLNKRTFVIGGPADSLEEAKVLTYREISRFVAASVQSVSASYTSISSDNLLTAVKEQFTRSVAVDSSSVLVGLEFTERWQDPKSGEWWVLASVTEEALSEGIEKTAEKLTEKEAVMKAYAADIEVILSDLAESKNLKLRDKLEILSRAQQALMSSEFPNQLKAKIEGSRILVQPFLLQAFREVLDTVSVQIVMRDSLVHNSAPIHCSLITASLKGEQTGELSWILTADDEEILRMKSSSFRTGGMISSQALPLGTQLLKAALDAAAMGITLPPQLTADMIPHDTFPLQVYAGNMNFQFRENTDYVLDDAESALKSLFSSRLPFTFTETSEFDYTLSLGIDIKEGTENACDVIFRHMSVNCFLIKNGEELLYYASPFMKGGGLDETQALGNALEAVIEDFEQRTELFMQIRQYSGAGEQ